MGTQMDIDDCLVENAKKISASWKPGDDPVDWPAMVQDMLRIIGQLKSRNEELREAVLRTAKE